MRLLLLFGLVAIAGSCLGSESLPVNGGFEKIEADGMPAHWSPLIIGANAEFAVDKAVVKSEESSIRISAPEVTRSYIRSDAIPVAPGERIGATMWVQQTNVPAGQGTVIAIAEFLNAQQEQQGVAKIAVADVAKSGWQLLSGSVAVPENTAFLKLRLGFSYAQGTCWWDQVQLRFQDNISARFNLSSGRLSPATGALPIALLNRSGSTNPVEIRVKTEGQSTNLSVKLSGKPVEPVLVPMRFPRPGKHRLEGSVWTNGAQACSFNAQATVPPPLTLDPLIPTHWVVEDGKPRIQGRVHIALPEKELDRLAVQIRVIDSAQKTLGERTLTRLRDDSNDFELDLPELPEGDYTFVAEFKGATRSYQDAREPWSVIPRRRASVTLNERGFPVYDGRVIFPLGVFNGGARMREMSNGFTVSHAYNSVEARLLGHPDDARAKAFLDESERAGLKALMLVPRHSLFARDWDQVRRRILTFRNHPGLLAWDEEEGIARGDMKPDVLVELSKIIRELDPHHPLMVGDSRDVIGRIPADRADFFLDRAMDMGMWWWYPFPLAEKKNALEGDEGAGTRDQPQPSFLVNASTSKPIWVGIQAYKKPAATARYPTRAEYRFQAYAAICAGARGLMWYGGSVTGGAYLKPQEADWEFIKSLAAEIGSLSAVLTGEVVGGAEVSPAGAQISTAIRKGDRTVLFAVNRTPGNVAANIRVPGWATAERLPEKQRASIADGGIYETFEPFGVRIYELR